MTEEQSEAILKKYNVSKKQLPKITKNDPAISELEAVPGDIIEITRESPTTGKSYFYRVVA
jgi:DNA-directed RNA polymerase subunit H